MQAILDVWKEFRRDIQITIGATATRILSVIIAVFLLKLAVSETLSVSESTGRAIDLALIAAFVIVFLVGLVTHHNPGTSRPLLGASLGFVAGILAAIVGGIPYYIGNYQGVAVPHEAQKFLRVLISGVSIGLFVGALLAFLGTPFSRSVQRTDATTSSKSSTTAGPIHLQDRRRAGRLFRLASHLLVLAFVLGLWVWFANTLDSAAAVFGTDEQGNIVYWQLECILFVFIVSFCAILCGYDFDYIADSLRFNRTKFVLASVLVSFVFAGLMGSLLFIAFGDAELEVVEGGTTVADIVVRILSLLLWLVLTYVVTVPYYGPFQRFARRQEG